MTKRNYQIIQMAENQMKEENEKQNPPQEERKGITPEIIAQMLENEQNEINEAIKQSLADEDEKRRMAIIEEELKRTIKQSLKQPKKKNLKNLLLFYQVKVISNIQEMKNLKIKKKQKYFHQIKDFSYKLVLKQKNLVLLMNQ